MDISNNVCIQWGWMPTSYRTTQVYFPISGWLVSWWGSPLYNADTDTSVAVYIKTTAASYFVAHTTNPNALYFMWGAITII